MSQIATLADIEAIEKVPLEEQNLPSSTYEMLLRGAELGGNKVALSFFLRGSAYDRAVEFTYPELIGNIRRTANMFHDLGVGPDDVVSMVLPNLPQSVFTLWGAEAAGIVNPINPLLDPPQIVEIMRAARTKVLVTLAPFPKLDIWEKVDLVRREVPTLSTILQVDMCQYLTGFRKFLVHFLVRRGAITYAQGATQKRRATAAQQLSEDKSDPALIAKLDGGQEILDFDELVKDYPADRLVSGREIQSEDIASYFHTGGTTGMPKLALHTHANEVFDAWSASRNLVIGPGEVMFCGLPLFHVNGVLVTGLIPWGNGGSVVLGTPRGYRDPDVVRNFWKIVERYKINYFSGVPTLVSGLLDVPRGGADISSLVLGLCGAAPMPVEIFRRFEAATGVRILEGYGLTEAACISSVNPPFGERRVGSIGYRLPYQEMKSVVMDGNGRYERDCQSEEIGLVVVRGPNVFPGYMEDAQNRDAWVDCGDGDGPWLNTGDLGRQDTDGYFWLTGRTKELIVRGGHNIDPQLIEAPLHKHPAVALAAAVGSPHPHAGEMPVAYVQLKPGSSVTAEQLEAFAEEHAGERAAVPKRVKIVETIPQTAVGKVFKPQLWWWEIEEVYRHDVARLEGVSETKVAARPDSIHGVIAEVTVRAKPGTDRAALEDRIAKVLGRYAVRYELELE